MQIYYLLADKDNTGESDAVGGVDIAVDRLMELGFTRISSDTKSLAKAGSVKINDSDIVYGWWPH